VKLRKKLARASVFFAALHQGCPIGAC